MIKESENLIKSNVGIILFVDIQILHEAILDKVVELSHSFSEFFQRLRGDLDRAAVDDDHWPAETPAVRGDVHTLVLLILVNGNKLADLP